MPRFLHKKERSLIGTTRQDFLQGRLERITIPFAFAQLLANRKSQSHADDLSEAGHVSPFSRTKKPISDAALL